MPDSLARLTDNVAAGNVTVLTGAGMSTDSGIPDYRGPDGIRRRTPMTFDVFIADAGARRRYWARSHLGWSSIAAAEPNLAHVLVARLEGAGSVRGVITQNVDGLHQAAGSRSVVDLHGRLDRVLCLSCGARSSRHDLDVRLRMANPHFHPHVAGRNPDGDAEIADDALGNFVVVDCVLCGGVLKPDVVFFGENVRHDIVSRCFELVEAAEMLLVLGSSLTVLSGYRFVRRATQRGIPVAIINRGPTRGDHDAAIRIDGGLAETLSRVVAAVDRKLLAEPALGPTCSPRAARELLRF